MGVAHVVYVGAFHEHYILFHLFALYGVATLGARFVAVHAFEFHGLAVHVEVTSLKFELVEACGRVFYLHFPEAGVCGHRFDGAPFLVFQLGYENVAPRCFGRPFLRVYYRHFGFRFNRFSAFELFYGGRSSCSGHTCGSVAVKFNGIQGVVHAVVLCVFLREVAYVGAYAERAVYEVCVEVGCGREVAYLHFRLGG